MRMSMGRAVNVLAKLAVTGLTAWAVMDGLLWPGQSAAFTLDNNGVTDSSGFVVLRVRHGQRFAFWATYQISAGAATAGSDPPTTYNYTLSAAKADVDSTSAPGFAVSPFGTATVCTNPN